MTNKQMEAVMNGARWIKQLTDELERVKAENTKIISRSQVLMQLSNQELAIAEARVKNTIEYVEQLISEAFIPSPGKKQV